MKKIFLIITLSLSLLAVQSCNSDKNEKADEKTLSTTDVPAPVQTAFSAKYSTATEVKWEDAHENNVQTYKAKFMVNGKKMKAEFDANGGLVKEEEDN
jgi:thiol:disulfide interchange protein